MTEEDYFRAIDHVMENFPFALTSRGWFMTGFLQEYKRFSEYLRNG